MAVVLAAFVPKKDATVIFGLECQRTALRGPIWTPNTVSTIGRQIVIHPPNAAMAFTGEISIVNCSCARLLRMTSSEMPIWQEPVRGFYADPGQFLALS